MRRWASFGPTSSGPTPRSARAAVDPAPGAADPGAAAAGVLLGPLRALPLQASYSARSGRRLIEQPGHNLLFRCWSVGLGIDEPAWGVTVVTTDRDRLPEGGVAKGLRSPRC